MPILLNTHPNPKAVMLGRQHLRKIMLGGDVVWQKFFTLPPEVPALSLDSLDDNGVKLTAVNQNGNLFFPMFFPARPFDDERLYLDRLTFIKEAELSLQSIDALLEADVVKGNMLFPMYFFGLEEVPKEYDFDRKLTFVAKIDEETDYSQDFVINVYELPKTEKDYVQDFPINAYDPETDFIQDFPINAFDPTKDFIKDFFISAIEVVDFVKDFTITSIQTADFTKDFTLPVIQFVDYTQDFSMDARIPVYQDFVKDFDIVVPATPKVAVIYFDNSQSRYNTFILRFCTRPVEQYITFGVPVFKPIIDELYDTKGNKIPRPFPDCDFIVGHIKNHPYTHDALTNLEFINADSIDNVIQWGGNIFGNMYPAYETTWKTTVRPKDEPVWSNRTEYPVDHPLPNSLNVFDKIIFVKKHLRWEPDAWEENPRVVIW